ncbi:MAG: hypothetical protein AAF634_01395 [Bacteroidota bacterium]
MTSREDILKQYEAALELAGLERKGKSMPYTSANGHMFSQLNKAGELGIRLSKEDTAHFDVTYGAQPFMSYGATMREYVLVPSELLNDQMALSTFLKRGYNYVNSLPPK